MKLCHVNKENKTMLLSIDYWDAESMGYDVLEKKDVSGSFYHTILRLISYEVSKVFGDDFNYGIKTYVDEEKGVFYYVIKPYDERLNEFIMEEMIKNHYSVTFLFPYGIM